ncbi:MAG: hypothetical protein ACKV19_24580 [Verrucomicrobiales bacterium]
MLDQPRPVTLDRPVHLLWARLPNFPNSRTTQFTVFLPLPPPALWANSRVHWSVRHRETRFARRLARVEAVRALDGQPPPMWEAATMNVRFSMPHLRFDASNLMRSLKA